MPPTEQDYVRAEQLLNREFRVIVNEQGQFFHKDDLAAFFEDLADIGVEDTETKAALKSVSDILSSLDLR